VPGGVFLWGARYSVFQLKFADALGLTISAQLYIFAEEVIE
jgi:hypothetical protein